jgi:hypothetical protein
MKKNKTVFKDISNGEKFRKFNQTYVKGGSNSATNTASGIVVRMEEGWEVKKIEKSL